MKDRLKKFICGACVLGCLCIFDGFYYLKTEAIPFGNTFLLVHVVVIFLARFMYSLVMNHRARKNCTPPPYPKFWDLF